jgi:6-phosphofructokinase 1
VKVKSNVIGYQQRGGVPSALDRLHASGFAEFALDAIDKGVTNSYVVYKNGKYEYLDITEAENKKKDN